MLLCAVSQSTYFAVCYSGSLCFVLYGIRLSGECSTYCRKIVLTYTIVAWVVMVMNQSFMLYSMFFSGGYLDILLPPIGTYINVSNLMIPRIVMFLFSIQLNATWIFPHAMSFMLATIFTHQYNTWDVSAAHLFRKYVFIIGLIVATHYDRHQPKVIWQVFKLLHF